MAKPTPQQLETALKNLNTMREFNNTVFLHGNPCIENAYYLLTEPPKDQGLVYVLDFFVAAFETGGGLLGPGGGFAASLLGGLLSSWAGDPPGNLNGQFSDITTRFNRTSMDVATTLGKLHDELKNPATQDQTWNTAYEFQGRKATVASLGDAEMPDENTENFNKAVIAAVKAWDRRIWKQLLVANFRVPYRDEYRTDYKDEKVPPIPWIKEQIGQMKSSYFSYFWHPGDGGDCALWIAVQYDVEYNTTGFWALSDGACDYLFIDSVPGTVINPDGLFTREEVVQFLGIKIVTNDQAKGKHYLKAEQEGKTLLALYQKEGRAAIENRVIQKVQEDAAFARDLTRNPKETLEAFFDIRIPEHVQLTVVIEDPMNFGLVIRRDPPIAN